MKGLLKGLIVCGLILAVTVPAYADTELNFSGQIRLREEINKKSFDTSIATLTYADLRTRVGIEAIVDGNARAFVQFQDSRRLGGQDQFGQLTSGTLNDGKNVDVHQAYFQIDNLFYEGVGMKAGRFELSLGNERVLGAVGWSNVGRSWEGAAGWFDHEKFKITGFGLKAVEENNAYYNADYDIGGVYATAKEFNTDLFWMYEYDADTAANYYAVNELDRMNFGLYYHREYQDFDFEMNGVFQTGQMAQGPAPLYNSKIDIEAFMFQAEAGYTFPDFHGMRLAAGIDYTSGDDDLLDDKYQAYDNLYYTGHKFRGFMDYFVDVEGEAYEYAGLMDIVLRGRIKPHPDWKIAADAHFFSTAADYIYGKTVGGVTTPELTKDVGIELDGVVGTTCVDGVYIEGGGSIFMVKDAFAGMEDPDPGFWLYTQMIVDF